MRIRWRGLELPSQVACDKESLTATYGKFTAEPFERGRGNDRRYFTLDRPVFARRGARRVALGRVALDGRFPPDSDLPRLADPLDTNSRQIFATAQRHAIDRHDLVALLQRGLRLGRRRAGPKTANRQNHGAANADRGHQSLAMFRSE